MEALVLKDFSRLFLISTEVSISSIVSHVKSYMTIIMGAFSSTNKNIYFQIF